MADTFFFNGHIYSTPTTASQVDDTGFTSNQLGLGQAMAIVGNSYGGQPNVAITGESLDDFESVLISGDCLTMVNKALAPSPDPAIGAPSSITVIVVGEATQASGAIMSGNNLPIIPLLSTQYGNPANLTKYKIEAGSNSTSAAPSFKVSTALGTTLAAQDNIYRLGFSVSYSGSQSSATVTVTQASVVLAAPAGTPVATLNLNATLTVDQLVDQINGVPGFAAAIGPQASGTPTLGSLENTGGASDCRTSPVLVTATVQAIVDWLNSAACGLVVATNGQSTGTLPKLVGWTFLTGAAAPAPNVGDWANALNALQTVDCQHVSVLSSNPAVWAAADAHVQFMSTVARKERRAYYGPALGTSIAAVEAMPVTINSDRSVLCYPGYLDFDVNGNPITLPSYFTAGMIAAGFAGSPPGDAMTNKAFNVQGWEVILRNPTDTDALIQAGVCCMEVTDEGYKCVRSISTWLINDNYNRVEVSCGNAVDYMMRTIRAAVDQARGGRQGPQLLGLALSIAKSILTDLAVPLPSGPGVLVGDSSSPAFTDPKGSIVGDQLLITFRASPVIPNNFIGITVGLQAYSGTASA